MKIGILTYHWVANFGANLQALSTYNYLRQNGYEAIIINWVPKIWPQNYQNIEQITEHTSFINKHFNLTKVCRNNRDISKVIIEEKIDKVLIGSDAVLSYRPILDRFVFPRRIGIKYIRYSKTYDDRLLTSPFLGDFVKNSGISASLISASAQNCNFEKISPLFELTILKKKLYNFSNISVRDRWTQKMIIELSGNKLKPEITPDPVFAFNYNAGKDYLTKQYICSKYQLPDQYILFSVLSGVFSDLWIKDFENVCNKNGSLLVEFPRATQSYKTLISHKIKKPLPVLDWYYLIKYSAGYIGELMHPIIVSLHNGIPFYSIDTYGFFDNNGSFVKESSKIYDILEKFHLLSNYYHANFTEKTPTPTQMFDLLTSFDKEQCNKIASNLYESYLQMMINSI